MMAKATKRPPTATLVPNAAIEQATSALQALPEKPKEHWSLKDSVRHLQDFIRDALRKGYSYEEVAELLSKQGVSIAPSSLKYYMNQISRGSRPSTRAKTTTRRTRKDTGATVEEITPAAPEPEEPAAPQPETAPAEPKKRSPRSTTGTSSRTAAKRKPSTETTVSDVSETPEATPSAKATAKQKPSSSKATGTSTTKTKTATQRKKTRG